MIPTRRIEVAYYDLLLEKNVSANMTKAKELVAKYPDRLEFRGDGCAGFLAATRCGGLRSRNSRDHRSNGPKRRHRGALFYAAALRGNDRDTAAREIIATIPMDKLSSEERALIEAK